MPCISDLQITIRSATPLLDALSPDALPLMGTVRCETAQAAKLADRMSHCP